MLSSYSYNHTQDIYATINCESNSTAAFLLVCKKAIEAMLRCKKLKGWWGVYCLELSGKLDTTFVRSEAMHDQTEMNMNGHLDR